ncbi:hypothetical protein E5843_09190 [Luteimonas yindakuii]|uniref:M949_RS01915 family surface polysaccharide biosynthesis protein n=1 Tax=Luteimonas yindakuii TaxID=2565782 RepID=UPI0011077AA6|nr:hypothetical protein [Luteimonas yindakuii]QCO67893.2 hypothetical protein E5843_09190 [Luteimonas yindakuii]
MLLAALAACGDSTPPGSVGRAHSVQDTMQVEDIDVASPALPAAARDADRALRYTDAAGDNVLLLGQHFTTHSDDNCVVDRLTLHVTRHIRTPHGPQPFQEAWQHTEVVECGGLDFDGRFLDDALLVEDLDGDGFAEALVGLSTFCGGGIDPRQIKLVLHTRDRDFVLEGESIVQLPEGSSFGGSHAMTPHKDSIPPPFREALLAAWKRVRGG